MLRPDGTVKVLDFGLAKAMDPGGMTDADMTIPGMIIGTSSYMSPEQARGRPVDRRADVWALGAVLFEMLTGHRAHRGEEAEPDWAALPRSTPATIRALLRRCLARDPRRRLDSAATVRLEIEDAMAGGQAAAGSIVSTASGGRLAWAIAGVSIAALAAVVAAWAPWRPEPVPPETRTDIVTPATDDPASFALSPDGRQIVFAASGDGTLRLWLRALESTTAQPLVGTEGGRNPFWSPDGRSIGFFTDTSLKRLDSRGWGRIVAAASSGAGGHVDLGRVHRVRAQPEQPADARVRLRRTAGRRDDVRPAADWTSLAVRAARWPPVSVLRRGSPGRGRHLPGRPRRKRVDPLDTRRECRRVSPCGLAALGARGHPGRATPGRVWGALTGEPVTVDDGVAVDTSERSAVSVAATGLLAYRTGGASQRQLAWFDATGKPLGALGAPDPTWGRPRVSPDGGRVIVGRTVQGNQDFWLLDGKRTSRFTFDAATDDISIWSPDGTRIVFTSTRTGGGDLYQKPSSGEGAED